MRKKSKKPVGAVENLAIKSTNLTMRPIWSVTSPLISTIWCFRAYKLYIFCEDMILATFQCQHIFCCWVEPSLLLSSWYSFSSSEFSPPGVILCGVLLWAALKRRWCAGSRRRATQPSLITTRSLGSGLCWLQSISVVANTDSMSSATGSCVAICHQQRCTSGLQTDAFYKTLWFLLISNWNLILQQ